MDKLSRNTPVSKLYAALCVQGKSDFSSQTIFIQYNVVVKHIAYTLKGGGECTDQT